MTSLEKESTDEKNVRQRTSAGVIVLRGAYDQGFVLLSGRDNDVLAAGDTIHADTSRERGPETRVVGRWMHVGMVTDTVYLVTGTGYLVSDILYRTHCTEHVEIIWHHALVIHP